MNWKALVIALLCFSVQPTAVAAKDVGVTKEEWTYLCSQLKTMGYDKVNCRKIDKPTVVITKAVEDLAAPGWVLYGLTYDGESYVFVNSNLDPAVTRTVVVHETVHYVLSQFYGNAVGECESERAARIVHHKWERTDYDPRWELDYGCAK